MPKFGLASDLHLDHGAINPEFFDWRGDVLLLAGDIGEDDFLRRQHEFWTKVSLMAPEVYVIAGNHEFYRSEIDRAVDHLREYLKAYPNIKILDNDFVYTNGFVLFGSTFWSDFNRGNPLVQWDAMQIVNDYKGSIRYAKGGWRPIKPHETHAMHLESLHMLETFLKEEVGLFGESSMPMVVMTHHGPSYQSVSREYVSDKLNGAWVSDLDNFILQYPQIKAWVHGHVHTFKDYMIGDTRVMVNARGYPDERPAHLPPYQVLEFIIEA